MSDHEMTIKEAKNLVQAFSEERDWDQYHNPKELAIGIATEAGELLQHFRFKSNEQMHKMLSDPKKREEIEDELSDVFYFVLRLGQKYNIDLDDALRRKLEKNGIKYPVDKVKGRNEKYSDY